MVLSCPSEAAIWLDTGVEGILWLSSIDSTIVKHVKVTKSELARGLTHPIWLLHQIGHFFDLIVLDLILFVLGISIHAKPLHQEPIQGCSQLLSIVPIWIGLQYGGVIHDLQILDILLDELSLVHLDLLDQFLDDGVVWIDIESILILDVAFFLHWECILVDIVYDVHACAARENLLKSCQQCFTLHSKNLKLRVCEPRALWTGLIQTNWSWRLLWRLLRWLMNLGCIYDCLSCGLLRRSWESLSPRMISIVEICFITIICIWIVGAQFLMLLQLTFLINSHAKLANDFVSKTITAKVVLALFFLRCDKLSISRPLVIMLQQVRQCVCYFLASLHFSLLERVSILTSFLLH